jgi:hypothetical protein
MVLEKISPVRVDCTKHIIPHMLTGTDMCIVGTGEN